jgi:hypothetical protein
MLVIGLIVLAAVPFVDAVFGYPYAFFVAATLLLTAASGLISLERYAATSFPVFAALACTRRSRLLVCLLVFEFYMLMFFTAAFAAGWAVF